VSGGENREVPPTQSCHIYTGIDTPIDVIIGESEVQTTGKQIDEYRAPAERPGGRLTAKGIR